MKRECETCIKRKTTYCPNSIKCMDTNDMPFYQNRIMLLEENLKLKKQLEEWGHHLKCSKEMLDIQGQKGNYDYDEYMLGLYNGMEYVIALFETREPNYINGKDVEFTNNKIQQKEFIKWLKDEISKQKNDIFANALTSEDIDLYIKRIKLQALEEILQKYKEIIGDDK